MFICHAQIKQAVGRSVFFGEEVRLESRPCPLETPAKRHLNIYHVYRPVSLLLSPVRLLAKAAVVSEFQVSALDPFMQ